MFLDNKEKKKRSMEKKHQKNLKDHEQDAFWTCFSR